MQPYVRSVLGTQAAEREEPDWTEAVEALYRIDAARLGRSLFGFAASRSVAEDSVAEAFAQLLATNSVIRDPRAWGWRTAFRVAAGELQRRRQTVNELLVDVASTVSDDTLDLVAALQTLSDMQRKSVVLHDYAGYRAAEVARMIGSTEAAVRVHLMRGRRRLRGLLA